MCHKLLKITTKNVLIPIIFATSVVLAGASNRKSHVPEVVLSRFSLLFPSGASSVVWSKDDSDFKFQFNENHKMLAGYFYPKGNLLELVYKISIQELPEELVEMIEVDFKEHEITKIELINDFPGDLYYIVNTICQNRYSHQLDHMKVTNQAEALVKRQGVVVR